MTGWHIKLGYCARRAEPEEKTWQRVLQLLDHILDHPDWIAEEGHAGTIPPIPLDKPFRDYVNEVTVAGKNRIDASVTVYPDETLPNAEPQIMLLASGCSEEKWKHAHRRAIVRLLMRACHREDIELNVIVG